MAEREGFEPPIPVKVWLISSQLHSTGLCHLSAAADPLSSLLTKHSLSNTREAVNSPIAFVYAGLDVDSHAEFARLPPQRQRLSRLTHLFFEQRVAPNRICQIQRRNLLMRAINLYCLPIARSSRLQLPIPAKNISDMPHRVGKTQGIVQRSKNESSRGRCLNMGAPKFFLELQAKPQ